MSLAHGTNDAQKTMGVITLALIATGDWTDTKSIPFWVKVACALAIALGTYLGGWRIIRTLGKGLVEIAPPQGMAAAVRLGRGHPGLQPPRLRAVHHARRHRLDPRLRRRPAGRAGALAGRRPDGRRLADHAARRRRSSARSCGGSAT